MTRIEQIRFLIDILLAEMPEVRATAADVPNDLHSQRNLLRALMNIRPPAPLKSSFVTIQNQLLRAEVKSKGVVTLDEISTIDDHIRLWQGDITRLEVDAIVNAANSEMIGCFIPCHTCIDNAIHSAAGLQLRNACADIMNDQGHPESIGHAKITAAFNLPSSYVIHTVGPIIVAGRAPTREQEHQLNSCYRSCLELAAANGLQSIAFCCISTGEFHFPNERAAEIAVDAVKNFLANNDPIEVVFNVFKEIDLSIYNRILGGK